MKMFKIENNILRLQPSVKAGGKDAINKIGFGLVIYALSRTED
jgi:hypothetical protein